MTGLTAYRWLCGGVGILLLALGVGSVFGALAAGGPGGAPPGPIPVGPGGLYFMAFAGTALIGWAGGLLGAARQPETGRTIGTATAVALTVGACYRMFTWTMGDLAFLGGVLRAEAAVLLLLALAFVWLRPRPALPRA